MVTDPIRKSDADTSTLEQLSRAHRSALLRYFYRRGLNEADRDDAVQEVFARLARKAGLARIERIEGYLFETAANVAIDLHRQRGSRRADFQDQFNDDLHGAASLSPEDIGRDRESVDLLIVGLRELPERTRNVFILARFEHIKHLEIARRLGVSVSAVEKHLVKALTYLASRVGRGA